MQTVSLRGAEGDEAIPAIARTRTPPVSHFLSMTGIASSRTPRNDSAAIRAALTHLRNGGLLIYPTETSYAIGCDATNAAAVRAVFRAKGRAAGKSLPLIVASRAMAERYATLTPLARRLAQAHWPGPLTIVCVGAGPRPRPSGRATTRGRPYEIASGVIAPNGTVALRISSHPIARALSRRLGRPLVSTSANRSGESAAYSVNSAQRYMRSVIASVAKRSEAITVYSYEHTAHGVLLFDTGSLPHRAPSTIVDATGTSVRILRQGSVRV